MKKIIAFGVSILVLMALVLNMIPKVYANFFEDGYVMPDVEITKVLSSKETTSYDPIQLFEVKEDEVYSERFGKIYTESDHAISFDYPIFIQNHTAMRFMNNSSYVIDTSFNYVRIVENSILSNQTYFNSDGRAVDNGEYMLVQLPNKLFLSADKMTFKNVLFSEEINKNSLYHFDEDFVNVYEYDEGVYRFKTIPSVQSSTVSVGDLELPYPEFYEKLLNIKDLILDDLQKDEQIEEEIKEEIDNDNVVGKPNDAVKPDKPAEPDKTPTRPPHIKPELPEMEYVKPEVEVSNISTWVYTVNGNIQIKDPSSRILGGVVFYVYDEEGKLVLRQSVNRSGLFDLSILEPNKTFVVNAKFEYYNRNDLIATEVALENTVVRTLPFEGNVHPVSFSLKASAYARPKSFAVDESTLKNTTDYEVGVETLENFYKNTLPYIHKLTFMFEGQEGVVSTNVPSKALGDLKNGLNVSFETSDVLKPKTGYSYIVKAFDKFGNEIGLDPSVVGNYTTSKNSPSVRTSLLNADHEFVELKVQLKDEDDSLTSSGFKLYLYDMEGQSLPMKYEKHGIISEGESISFSKEDSVTTIKIYNLPSLYRFDIQYYGDYDLENGQGVLKDKLLGDFSFLSGDLPTGTIHFENDFYDIGDSYASMDLSLSKSSTAELLHLMSDLSTSLVGEDFENKILLTKQQFNETSIEENYDDARSCLLIQKGNVSEGLPEITLKASKEALLNQGVWNTFINSAFLGKEDKNAGVLTFTYLKNTFKPRTQYDFTMSASANVNGFVKELNSDYTNDRFVTTSLEPVLRFNDFFLAQNFLEIYDISVVDEGKTMLDNKLLIQLCVDNAILESHELKVGEVKEALRFNHLVTDKDYKLQFVVPEYQVGLDVEKNHVLKEFIFQTNEGVLASFNIDSIRNGYDSVHDDKFVINRTDIIKGHTFNTSSKQLVEDENCFITGFIPYNKGTYKAFQDFAAPGNKVSIVFFKSDYTYAGIYNYTPTTGFVIDEYVSNIHNTTSFAYMRIIGQTGYEKNARFYDLPMNELDALIDVKKNPNLFIDGIIPGTTGFDSASTIRSSTDYIRVQPFETLYVKANRNRYVYFYTEDHKYITSVTGGYSAQNNIIDVPSNAAYVRFSIENLDKANDVAAIYRIKDFYVKDYDATFNWHLEDDGSDQFILSSALKDHQYFIRKSISKSVDVLQYEEAYTKDYTFDALSDLSVNVNKELDETLPVNQAYKYEIYVQYHDREIVLDSFEMNTKNRIHILRNGFDLKQIQYDSFGTFIAVNDIREHETSYCLNANFGGTIDFQNHSLILHPNHSNSFISTLNPSGVIENIEVIMEDSYYRFFITNNYGRVSNLTYRILLDEDEYLRIPLIHWNGRDGIIENFVIQLNGNVTAFHPTVESRNNVLLYENSGMIRNGYAYNTDKNGIISFISRKGYQSRNGVIAAVNNSAGTIMNVYADINIASDYESDKTFDGYSKSTGIIVGSNSGRVKNVIAIGTRYSFDFNYDTLTMHNRHLSSFDDPMFGHLSSAATLSNGLKNSIYQNVMFYDTKGNTYLEKETIASKFDIANLYDETWYTSNINSMNQFDISYIEQGYFPYVKNTQGGLLVGQTLNPLPKVNEFVIPEYLDYVVNDVQNDHVDVTLKFKNDSKADISDIVVENLTASILEQQMVDDIYEVKVRLTNPLEFVTGYRFTSFTYRTLKGSSTIQLKVPALFDVSFYKMIYTIEDWNTWLCNKATKKLNYNYRLGNTLDFSGINANEFISKYRVADDFTGKLDGNGYTIQNIHFTEQLSVHSILFNTVKHAEIRNIEFKNISWMKETATYNALIHAVSHSTIDHVHLSNIELKGMIRVGALAATSSTSEFSNISADHITLRTNYRLDSLYMGGLIGTADMTNITNSYISNVDIETQRVDLSYGVGIGGMIGYGSSGTRLNHVYATGQIKTTSYAGGIAGSGTYSINEAYTDVYLETDGDYNAGIAGTTNTDAAVKNSFSVGHFIHSISNPLHTNRIISNENYWYLNNNYGYVHQTFNNVEKDELDSSALLSYEDFLNEKVYTDRIQLSNHFDFSDVSKGILPKLKDTEGNLLPYQKDHVLHNTDISVNTLYTEIKPEGNSEFYYAMVQVKHPGYEIDAITIDGMEIVEGYPKEISTSSESVHNYEIKTYKLNAYDKYNLKVQMHLTSDPLQTKELVLSVDYGRPLYWVIKDYATWQAVMETHGYGSENIMISGVVDFKDKSDFYHSITANRFEGDPANPGVIQNLEFTPNVNDSSLISTIYGQISNLAFENVHLKMSTTPLSYRYVGLVNIVQGEVSDLHFKNCSITDVNGQPFENKSTSAKVSLINTVSGNMHDVQAENITIKVNNTSRSASNVVAGLASYTYMNVHDIVMKDVHIQAYNGFYIGGIVGVADRRTTEPVTFENVYLTTNKPYHDADYQPNIIIGMSRVGGILGYSTNVPVVNVFAENVEVSGHSTADAAGNRYAYSGYIGGVVGTVTNITSTDKTRPTIQHAKVTAYDLGRAGGVGGSLQTTSNLTVENVEVISTTGAGGIAGLNNSTVTNCLVKDSKITSEVAAGGVVGVGLGVTKTRVENTTIVATKEKAGGILGSGASYDTYNVQTSYSSPNIGGCVVLDCVIQTPTMGGGIIGNAYTTGASAYRNAVSHTKIEVGAGGYAGGISGHAYGYNMYMNIVNNNTTLSNLGSYTGGIAGSVEFNNPTYNTYFYQNISVGNISGKEYTGGIVGYFNSNILNPTYNTYLYSDINMSSIQSNGTHVYGFGSISENAFASARHKLHLSSFNTATINGQMINDTQLSNLKQSGFDIITLEDFSDYSRLTGGINETNYAFSTDAWYSMLNVSCQLENFAISFKGFEDSAKQKYQFKVEGVGLNPGDYKLDMSSSVNGAPMQTFDIHIDNNGLVTDNQTNSDILVTQKPLPNAYMSIYLVENGQKQVYAMSSVKGINTSRTYHPLLVNGVVSNYRKAKIYDNNQLVVNETLTIDIDNPGGHNYKWYRIYKDNSYGGNYTNVTHMAKGPTLTTNLAGVYFALSEDSTQVSELFRYDGVVYYPLVSGNTTTVYEGQEYIPLAPAYKKPFITEQKPEVVNFPAFDVYSSGVNTINVEFDDTMEMVLDNNPQLKITLTIAGQEYTYDVNSRVMSFNYDYCAQDGLFITLSDELGNKTPSKHYSNQELVQTISLGKENYYYIDKDQNVQSGSTSSLGTTISGPFVHIYGEQGLRLDGKIVDLNSPQETLPLPNGSLVERVPLKSDVVMVEQEAHEIEYYHNFMYDKNANKVNREMIYNTLSGKVHGFDGGLSRKGNGLVLDFIQVEDETLSVSYMLGLNGRLVYDEASARLPEKFSNSGILELAFNVHSSDNKFVMIKYPTKVYIWDYETGEVVLDEKVKDASMFSFEELGQFVSVYFENFMSFMQVDSPVVNENSYEHIISELNKIPNSEMNEIQKIVLNGNISIQEDEFEFEEGEGLGDGMNTESGEGSLDIEGDLVMNSVSRDYVPIYNPLTHSYDIYTTQEILSSSEPMSEMEKIQEAVEQGFELSDVSLSFNQKKDDSKDWMKTQFVLYVGIFASVVGALYILRKKLKSIKN